MSVLRNRSPGVARPRGGDSPVPPADAGQQREAAPDDASTPGSTTPPLWPFTGVQRWCANHPGPLDVGIAVLVLALMLVAAMTPPGYPKGTASFTLDALAPHTLVLALLACGSLIWRRAAPLAMLAITVAVTLTDLLLTVVRHPESERQSAMAIAIVVALFTTAIRTDRRTTFRAAVVTVLTVTAVTMGLNPQPWYAAGNLGVFAWLALAAFAGEALRSRRAMINAIRERAERAERTREEEARRRVVEERMRIARELHDVVAHHIAMVNVQAGVASHIMESRPDQAKEALGHVREASRQALTELQATVGLLRQKGEPVAPTEPAPGLDRLDELIEGFRRIGMRVTVRQPLPDERATLTSAVNLTAYRLVQEALTNVQKHAGGEASAQVAIVMAGPRGNLRMEIEVRDDGRGTPEPAVPGGGHGLTGMRERVEALGGEFRAGPRSDGTGFQVHAVLPLSCPGDQETESDDRAGAATAAGTHTTETGAACGFGPGYWMRRRT